MVKIRNKALSEPRIWFLILLLIGFLPLRICSQSSSPTDSIKKLISETQEDSLKTKLLFNLGNAFADTIPDSAIYYYKQVIAKASEKYNRKYAASAFNGLGLVYYSQGMYEQAVEAFFNAVELFEELGDKKGASSGYNNIGIICYENEEYDKAITYYTRSLKIFESLKDKKSTAACYNNIGLVYTDKGEYETAKKYFEYALSIHIEIEDKRGMAKCYNNIGNVYSYEKDYLKALEFFNKALKLKKELGDKIGEALVYVNISDANLLMQNYQDAISYAKKSLDIGLNTGSLMLQRDNYENLSAIYDSLRDYKSAFFYHKLFKLVYDSAYNKESFERITELQGKYNTEKKEREIEKLNSVKESQELKIKQSRTIIVAVIVGGIMVLIIALSLFNLYKQKQLRRRTLTAIIDTESKERKRFAEDLHDGLGPLLSSIGLYVNELHSDKYSKEKKEEILSTATELIDDAIKNTRAIANNLMPGILSDYGLIHALESFCEKIRNTGAFQINFRQDIGDKRYDSVIEACVYRIVQELINNTIKYAEARKVDIEISDMGKSIVLIYSDNGKGFNIESVLNNPNRGNGLNNIRNRVSSLGGRCDFKSAERKGFLVTIEITK